MNEYADLISFVFRLQMIHLIEWSMNNFTVQLHINPNRNTSQLDSSWAMSPCFDKEYRWNVPVFVHLHLHKGDVLNEVLVQQCSTGHDLCEEMNMDYLLGFGSRDSVSASGEKIWWIYITKDNLYMKHNRGNRTHKSHQL